MSTHLVHPAGKIAKLPGDNAGDILYGDVNEFTQNSLNETKKHEPTMVFGKPTRPDKSIFPIFPSCDPTVAEDAINDVNEFVYVSKRKQPIGTAFKRGFSLPHRDAYFGIKSPEDRCTVAHLINPADGKRDEIPDIKALYIRTHKDFDSGQQECRYYNWPTCVTKDFEFGCPDPKHPQAIYEAFAWDPKVYDASKLTDRYLRFSNRNRDYLGRTRPLQGKLPVKPDFRFGVRCLSVPRDTALHLLAGS